jgi:hypothetical protein
MVMDGRPKKGRAPRIVLTEPEVLTIVGRESQRNGTDRLTERQIDQIIPNGKEEKSGKNDAACAFLVKLGLWTFTQRRLRYKPLGP